MTVTALPTMRQSHLARADLCPLSARFEEEATAPPTHATARGSAFHEFARRVIAGCIEAEAPTLDPEQGKEIMDEVLREPAYPVPVDEYDELMGIGYRFCAGRRFDLDHIVDLDEEQYEAEIGGVRVTGKPDYVSISDGTAVIRDYSTSWAISDEKKFQLRLYGRLVLERWPQVERCRLEADFVRWARHEQAVDEEAGLEQRIYWLDRHDLPKHDAALEALIARVLASRLSGEWEAIPGSWCQTCADQLACPVPARERREGALLTLEDAIAAAEYLAHGEPTVKAAKQALRAWVDKHGRVQAGDLEWRFKDLEPTWRVRDKDALRMAFEHVGLDWESYFTWVPGSTRFESKKVEA